MNELTTVEQQEMQRSSGVVMPVASPEEMHNAMVLYQRMKEAILDPTDYQDAGRGQRFVKKSGWAKLAIAFGASSEIIDERYERDEAGDLLRARFKVRAIAPNGRYAEGFGVCDIKEERFTHGKDHPKGWWKAGDPNNRDKIEHDLPSTAETRARNRAYSALFGHGEVSYEEVQANGNGDDITDADFRHTATPARERERYTPAQRDAIPEAAKREAERARAAVQSAIRGSERPGDALALEQPRNADEHRAMDRAIGAAMLRLAQRDQMELTDVIERVKAAGGLTGSIKEQPMDVKQTALDWINAELATVPVS